MQAVRTDVNTAFVLTRGCIPVINLNLARSHEKLNPLQFLARARGGKNLESAALAPAMRHNNVSAATVPPA